MNTISLITASLTARRLNSFLSILLTALGVMVAVVMILFSQHIQNRIGKHGGVDFIIGAKGSPLQLVLSSLYHIDIPTGNMEFDEAEHWMHHPQIKSAIPLALGDSYHGFRIVGTIQDYIKLYNGSLASGTVWNAPFQAVAGSDTGLNTGDQFIGAHGLEGGHEHAENPYHITGILKPTGTVLDRLILTSLESVWHLHEDHEHDHEEKHEHEEEGDITALLIKTRSHAATLNLSRQINRNSNVQAAIPAYEVTRLTSMLGLGSQTGLVLSMFLIAVAALSIFSGLLSVLDNRIYDLAVMRTLGFHARRLFLMILCEGMILVAAGLLLGLLMGHIAFDGLIQTMPPLKASGANAWIMYPQEGALIALTLLAGILAAFIPAYKATKIDISKSLSHGLGILIFISVLTCLFPCAYAFEFDKNPDETTKTLSDYVKDYVDVPKGAVDWKIFGQTKEIKIETKDAQDYDVMYQKPEFSPAVKAMDKKTITIKGFMFPLDESDAQSLFLLGPFPVTCPFHYHTGASLILEVHTADKKPIQFSYDPIVITGTVELVANDPEYSVFYRLKNARLVK